MRESSIRLRVGVNAAAINPVGINTPVIVFPEIHHEKIWLY